MSKQELYIAGPLGNLEAILESPACSNYSKLGVVCHPHPLHEGTMHNKVVSTIAKTFVASGIPCLRFNFRGVGKSAGVFGNIVGEIEDGLAVTAWLEQHWPGAQLYLAGFSFGAYIAAALASKLKTQQLISVAPAIEHMPYSSLPKISCPWLIIQGEADEIVNPAAVYSWYENLDAQKTLVRFPEIGHFFHGGLIALQASIEQVC